MIFIDMNIKKTFRDKLIETTEKKKVLYSAVVLDQESHDKLLTILGHFIPKDWKAFAHHMTVAFGKSLDDIGYSDSKGEEIILTVTDFGISDMAVAVKVDGFYTENKLPHVTLAVNVAQGGKPYMSNEIPKDNWKQLERTFEIKGKAVDIVK